MIRSMTAFASAETSTPWGALAFELRSVNHRYLELNPRLPDELRAIEPGLRERVAAQTHARQGGRDLALPPERRRRLATARQRRDARPPAQLANPSTSVSPTSTIDFTGLLQWPGVLVQNDVDQEDLRDAAAETARHALADMLATRGREGERLGVFLRERLDGIDKSSPPCAVGCHRSARLCAGNCNRAWRTQARRGPAQLEPGRVEQELVLQLSRIDVDEELDRLSAHIAEARRVLALPDAVGRRMDFLMQEFNREANTLGSKSVDSRTTQASVELKVLIEQMREQVQNIE